MSGGQDPKEMVSVRMPADLLKALRRVGDETGESLSDVLRRASLLVLGICPTCERAWPEPPPVPGAELAEERTAP